MNLAKILFVGVAMIVITIIGDYFVKRASMIAEPNVFRFLSMGAVIYFVSAFGWFYVYKYAKFLTVGAIHSFGIVVMTVFISMSVFKEEINSQEIVALILGVISIAILVKNGVA